MGTSIVSVRLDDEMASVLMGRADACGMSRSSYMKMLLGESLWRMGEESASIGSQHGRFEAVEGGGPGGIADAVRSALREVLSEMRPAERDAAPSAAETRGAVSPKAPRKRQSGAPAKVSIKLASVG